VDITSNLYSPISAVLSFGTLERRIKRSFPLDTTVASGRDDVEGKVMEVSKKELP
jgi:hypothetical protein